MGLFNRKKEALESCGRGGTGAQGRRRKGLRAGGRAPLSPADLPLS